jgi:hypothetical protein
MLKIKNKLTTDKYRKCKNFLLSDTSCSHYLISNMFVLTIR